MVHARLSSSGVTVSMGAAQMIWEERGSHLFKTGRMEKRRTGAVQRWKYGPG